MTPATILPPEADTIAAIATASGPAGVGIVRVSGPRAFAVADLVTRTTGRKALPCHAQTGHTLRRVFVVDPTTGETIDDALRSVFHAPKSLTGENVVEIQGHGGTLNLTQTFAACLASGARAARPGEFSERAFANGKVDLAQAEAIADLVAAGSRQAQRAAREQLFGNLSRRVQVCQENLREALALVEASIDFPEEVGDLDTQGVDVALARAQTEIANLLAGADYGRRLREGVTVVLAGRPNVGKSSLLNALSGTDRAIVTNVPGTTRDVVEESLNLQGVPVRALDTAGLRDTNDPVEQIGVARARQAIENADVVVVVLDAQAVVASGLTSDEHALLLGCADHPCVIAANKADTAPSDTNLASIVSHAVHRSLFLEVTLPVVLTCATTGAGLSELGTAIVRAAVGDEGAGAGANEARPTPLVTNVRHQDALRRANEAIAQARETLQNGLPAELIAVDAHGALHALGEITGETAREDIIASIFARFCLGK